MTAQDIAQLAIAKARTPADVGVEARCSGAWTVHGIADLAGRLDPRSWPQEGNVVIDGSAITALDTSGAWLLRRTMHGLEIEGRQVRLEGLRPEFSSLVQLVASREVLPQVPAALPPGMLVRLGRHAWSGFLGTAGFLSFVGESFTVLLRSLLQPRRLRWRPILHNIQIAGFEALPITGLLSFLMGIVIAYQGADQLQRFGANIFIVDLVGLAMLRELSPLLTAIIIAGRSARRTRRRSGP